mmetsp:Transcript_11489/g.11506  ORF Transcript_11489/g.11506 Transcript_11489/m.11506 type:complete len:162 (+) Transcript_11489:104-589(+)|eukprot:CAMPEP_0182418360 /NCGR_PEP_ID=MMETSP1167-20130531/2812_1 /TAXON_ID=2988 /ORGANISM="Mallomonas Sp, Strain CCMP3275" /LENGTH=161 /DNA_ID=CAMNT_0024592529 /DNA_START=104 /DNA_END=589 /DNA_ORIENTATION=-
MENPVENDNADEIKEQDKYLPIANVARIMKKMLPVTAKIAKDGKECMQECVSEFISFITSEAEDRCLQEKRKTVSGDDILWAMGTLGFDNYVEPLNLYLEKYRLSQKSDRPEKRQKKNEDGEEDDDAQHEALQNKELIPTLPSAMLRDGTTEPKKLLQASI